MKYAVINTKILKFLKSLILLLIMSDVSALHWPMGGCAVAVGFARPRVLFAMRPVDRAERVYIAIVPERRSVTALQIKGLKD